MAIKLFHHQASGTAVLVTAQGIGAVIGALALMPVAARVGRRRLLIADLALLPVLLVLYGLAPNLALAAVALLAVGAAYIGVLAGLNTVVQLRAPEALRGRILSLYMLALGVIYPIGAIIQGAVADRVGLRTVVVGTAVLLLAVLVAFYLRRPHLAESLDDPGRVQTTLDAVASRVA
ncbi:MAG TPA: MFS transporter, partial [Acidimicrobiales bacterium]